MRDVLVLDKVVRNHHHHVLDCLINVESRAINSTRVCRTEMSKDECCFKDSTRCWLSI